MSEIITEIDLELITETVEMYSTKYTKQHKFLNKECAIYDSITHNNCLKCNALKKKIYTYCDRCSHIVKVEKYKEKSLLDDWSYPIYSDYFDKYFDSEDDLVEFIEEYEEDNEIKVNLEECLLYPCKPNTLPELEYNDLDVEEAYELPEYIQQLLDQLNEVAAKEIISYSPDFKNRIEVILNNE